MTGAWVRWRSAGRDGAGLTGPVTEPARDGEGTGAAVWQDDLRRLGGREPVARALLTALAWGRGPGLPFGLWVPVAHALARADRHEVTAADARWLLRKVKGYVTEAVGPGGRAYRLSDPLLGVRLRAASPGATEELVTRALGYSPGMGSRQLDWSSAHPYLRSYLVEHAAAAGPDVLAALAREPGFLAAADPTTTGPLLCLPGPRARETGRVYQRVRAMLGDDPHTNAAYLEESARALNAALVSGGGPAPVYRTRLAAVRRDDSLLTLTGHTSWVNEVAFGTLTGEAGRSRLLLASSGRDSTIRLWDPLTGWPLGEPLQGHTASVVAVAFGATAEGRLLLASTGQDSSVRLWDPIARTEVCGPLLGHTGHGASVAFGTTPGGRLLLASGATDAAIRLWDPLTGTAVGGPLLGHTDAVISVAFGTVPGDGDGSQGRLLLASASRDRTVRLWDPLTGEPAGEPLTGHTGYALSVSFGTVPGDGGAGGERLLLASGGSDRTIRLWDPVTGMPIGQPLVGHTDRVWTARFGTVTGNGVAGGARRLLLVSGGTDNTVRVWDPLADSPVGRLLLGHTGEVNWVDFATLKAEGQAGAEWLLMATASDDMTVRLWDPLIALPSPAGHADPPQTSLVDAVAFGTGPEGADGGWPLLASSDGNAHTVRRWDLATGNTDGEPLAGHKNKVCALAFGNRGNGTPLLASGSSDGTLRLWDPVTGKPAGDPLTGHVGPVTSVAFGTTTRGGETGPTRLLLASAGEDAEVHLWDAEAGQPLGSPLAGHTGWVGAVAFGQVGGDGTPGGRLLLASAGDDATVRLWDPLTGATVGRPLRGHAGAVLSLAFASVAGERSEKRWPAGPRNGKGRCTWGGSRALLASAGEDGTVRLWDPLTGAPIGQPLTGHTGWVASVAFLRTPAIPALLVSGSADRTVRVWDVAAGRCALLLRRRHPVRCLAAAGLLLAIGDDDGLTVIELDEGTLTPVTRRRALAKARR